MKVQNVQAISIALIIIQIKQCYAFAVNHKNFRNNNNQVKTIPASTLRLSSSSNDNNNEFKIIDDKISIRGDRYFETNSTIPHANIVSEALGVQPPIEASKEKWQRAWKIHKRALTVLHAFDSCKPSNSKLNLACIWWKAMSGNDRLSSVYDDGLSYALLPSKTRVVVSRPFIARKLYPRLHHANVELRTAYLDKAVKDAVKTAKNYNKSNKKMRVRLISMGAGYDVRSIKLRMKNIVDAAYEFDLPEVVDAKERLFERARKRRSDLVKDLFPICIGVDLNDEKTLETKFREILEQDSISNESYFTVTIILFEAVMIYLDEGIPTNLLKTCSKILNEYESNSSNHVSALVFADRLEHIPGGDHDIGIKQLKSTGWELLEWCPKPGLARHMGRAILSKSLI